MAQTVFFSWQADTPTRVGRNFLKDVIEEVCKSILADTNIDESPRDLVVDSDTQNVAGQPPIVDTIFNKIDTCSVFVADITFVGKRLDGRLMPNPNVLIEYGRAIKSLNHQRVISVMNTAYGKPTEKDLPFNLRHVRWPITFTLPEDADNTTKTEEKKKLIVILKQAINASLAALPPTKATNSAPDITDIIRQNPADKIIYLRKHLLEVLAKLDAWQPKMHRDGGTVDELISAIEGTEPVVMNFSELAETIALMNDTASAKEVFQWFGEILGRYNPPANKEGRTSNADGDFFKFVGNELFVVFVMPFLREKKTDALREILKEDLRVAPGQYEINPKRKKWHELSSWMPSLVDESRKRNRMSLHDDLLIARHSKEPLSKIAPLRNYQDTDFFLFLHGPGITEERYGWRWSWYPRSILLARHTPEFILEAKNYPYAISICQVLQIGDIDELKRRLTSSMGILKYDWTSPISAEDVQEIGTEGGGKIIT